MEENCLPRGSEFEPEPPAPREATEAAAALSGAGPRTHARIKQARKAVADDPEARDALDAALRSGKLPAKKGGADPVSEEDYSGRVLETIRKRPGLTSGNKVKEFTKGNAQQIGNALKDLLRDGRVVKTPNGYEVVPEPVPDAPRGTA